MGDYGVSLVFENVNCIDPGRLTWNLQITHLERTIIFKTSMTMVIMFHLNLQGTFESHVPLEGYASEA